MLRWLQAPLPMSFPFFSLPSNLLAHLSLHHPALQVSTLWAPLQQRQLSPLDLACTCQPKR